MVRPLSGPTGRGNNTGFQLSKKIKSLALVLEAKQALYCMSLKKKNLSPALFFSRSEEAESVAGARVFGGAGKFCLGDLRNPRYFGSAEIGTEELPRRH